MKEGKSAKSRGICNYFVTSVLSVKYSVAVIFLNGSSKIQVTLRHSKTFLCLVPVTYRQRVMPDALWWVTPALLNEIPDASCL